MKMQDIPRVIDVAITFLSQDENIAKQLHSSLKERLDVFYYAERQGELVGTDGEDSFGNVFRDRARIVVVLYRKGWGETVMTRAERSGIKQRAIKEGYGFSIWVPLDQDKSIPSFLDPQFIWFDYDRWGNQGLAAVIEDKVKESGLNVRPETVYDRLSKFKQRAELTKAINEFLWSGKGIYFLRDAESQIESIIKEKIEAFQQITTEIKFGVEKIQEVVSITSYPYRMNYYVMNRSFNTVHGTKLVADLRKAEVKSGYYDEQYEKVSSYKFSPTLDDSEAPVWKLEGNGFYSLEELVNYTLGILVDKAIIVAQTRLKDQ